jgi:hypothetical protein
LIGVIPKSGQVRVVEEFFELFKTPWEMFRADQAYDVVVVSADEIPDVQAKLLIVFGPSSKNHDVDLGILCDRVHPTGAVKGEAGLVPIYRNLTTFTGTSAGECCVKAGSEIAGLTLDSAEARVIRLGYDLFDEVQFLLSEGQPPEYAHIPTLDIHIEMLRRWILAAGISFLEIPPVPAGYQFAVCLTHDIDFIGIRQHLFDHTMWGFVYRATAGALFNFARGRLSLANLLRSWMAAASLPFVYAGWVKDFWEPFEWYLEVEKELPATYFLIPFKGRAGLNVPGRHRYRRATTYDVSDVRRQARSLRERGCEIGVHGIDAWHSAERGCEEIAAVDAANGGSVAGIRMHWLLRDRETPVVLERAGYTYDSTCGYNETIGYRAGTAQVFRPLDVEQLLEIPLHIQDGALFYRSKLDLSEQEAAQRCQRLIDNAEAFGGVLTVLWHDRSHGPERFWGGFYSRLVQTLLPLGCWFATAKQVTCWFRVRREVGFERSEGGAAPLRLCYDGKEIQPPLRIRIWGPASRRTTGGPENRATQQFVDLPWSGNSTVDLEQALAHLEGSGRRTTVCAP